MGQILSLALDGLARSFGPRELRVLMLGLDAAGKTTVLYKLKLGEKVTTIPTIGFNVETVHYKNVNFTVWDVGGQHRIRQLWSHYYHGTQALIFVVDSSDRERILEARDELHGLINNPSLVDVSLLVLANKCDLPQSMNVAELTEKLQLPVFKRTTWFIQSCCATSGEGLYEGLNWLTSAVNNVQRSAA